MSDKIEIKMKNIFRDKEGHYIMINRLIQEEDITNLNIYTPNLVSLQYISQLLTTLNGQINNSMIILGDLTPHLQQWTNQSDRKSIRKHRP